MTQEVSYLTSEGAERLQKELDYLKNTARVELAKRLRAAINREIFPKMQITSAPKKNRVSWKAD